jgi:hypothetical protein
MLLLLLLLVFVGFVTSGGGGGFFTTFMHTTIMSYEHEMDCGLVSDVSEMTKGSRVMDRCLCDAG